MTHFQLLFFFSDWHSQKNIVNMSLTALTDSTIEQFSKNAKKGIQTGNSKNESTKKSDPNVPKMPKYMRGKPSLVDKTQNNKLKGRIKKQEKKFHDAAYTAARSELLLTEEPGYLEAEGMEKTFKFTQAQLKNNLDVNSASKIFDLKLTDFGPYALKYTRNGRYMLIGGRKGHVATFDWQTGKLGTELHLKETVRDVQWLHNETMFAAAQKKYVYIYDRNGLEIHCLKKCIEVTKLDFLPYHFLLVSVGNSGQLHWQDTSTGETVAQFRTKLGKCDVMAQNPYNAIMHLGHANGTVTLWSPNIPVPLVKILTHKGPVRALAMDRGGHYMATSGLDGKLRIWDIRTYKSLHEYYTPTPAGALSISQLGLLGVGWGPHISIWKDAFKTKQSLPYMSHLNPATSIHDLQFCPYDDALGFGHTNGVSSIVIPGSGEPNYDALEVNLFQTTKQRQEAEIHSLLDKIQPDMITLDPTFIGKMDRAPKEVITKERMEDYKAEHPEELIKLKNRARGKSSASNRYLRKQHLKENNKRKQLTSETEEQKTVKNTEVNSDKTFDALDRFTKRRKN